MNAVIEQQAAQQARVENDEILFAGRVRTNTMHLIRGTANKSRRGSTVSVCGKTVSNTYRAPSADEKVCKYCERGQRALGFSTHNQPRTCQDCGRRYADNASRDCNESVCTDCYEKQGIINSHLDGYHRDDQEGRQDDCPECASENVQEVPEAEGTGSIPADRAGSESSQDVHGVSGADSGELAKSQSREGEGSRGDVEAPASGSGDLPHAEVSTDEELSPNDRAFREDTETTGRGLRDMSAADDADLRGSRSRVLPGADILRTVRARTRVSGVQPRTGGVQGRHSAHGKSDRLPDSSSPDTTIPPGLTGIVNAHLDGEHTNAPDAECSMCQATAQAAPEAVVVEAADVAVETPEGGLILHSGSVSPDAEPVVMVVVDEHDEGDEDAVRELLELEPSYAPPLAVRYAEERVTAKLDDMVARLRRLADDLEREHAPLIAEEGAYDPYGALDRATDIARRIDWMTVNMGAAELIRDVAKLQVAREQYKR